MQYPVAKYPNVHYQWQCVRGDYEQFHVKVISWQFEHFWANNWPGINNSHITMKLWFNDEKLFHWIIFIWYHNYPLALKPQDGFGGFNKKNSLATLESTPNHQKAPFIAHRYLFWMTCSNAIIPSSKISVCTLPLAVCSGGLRTFWYFRLFLENLIISD